MYVASFCVCLLELTASFGFKAFQAKEESSPIEDAFGDFNQCTYTLYPKTLADIATTDFDGDNFDDYFKWMVRNVGDFVCYC